MFENLTEKFAKIVHDMRGYGKLTQENIAASLQDMRQALLAADVPVGVIQPFLENVQAKAIGQAVVHTITPGQRLVKIVHDELVTLLGERPAEFNIAGTPGIILMVGLQGSGKTTSAVKLGKALVKGNKKVLLAACDTTRPAAMEQLEILGRQAGLETFKDTTISDPLAAAQAALDLAHERCSDVLILDTAGRLHVDEALLGELSAMGKVLQPKHVLLVMDAMVGQISLELATHFHQALGVTGFILTKLDGDARGGAALSLRAVTQKPIFWAGLGEKVDDLEVFYPDRMASRILGMGDVLGLVEKAQEAVDLQESKRLAEKVKRQDMDMSDLLGQLEMMKKMGPLENVLKMLPGAQKLKGVSFSGKELTRAQAIIQSMTMEERQRPELLDGSRRQRIALGSGTHVAEVNRLLDGFRQMKKMMKQFGGMARGRWAGPLAGLPF